MRHLDLADKERINDMFNWKLSNGMRIFTIIWLGQLVSVLGTGMTRFALMIWAYQQTGQATTLALIGFFAWAPFIVFSPFAGVWVDRLNRRWVMIGANLGQCIVTASVLGLFFTGQLAIWHIYLLEMCASLFDAFQAPAYTAATTTLLSKQEFARANGMRSLASDSAQIAAPIAAGALLPFLGIGGVMLIDGVTFMVALLTLWLVRIPTPSPQTTPVKTERFLAEASTGFQYIFQRKGLLGLLLIFTGIHFFASLTYFAVLPTLILARSGGNETALGLVQAALGVGGVVGGLLVSIWGLPRRKIHAILGACALSFLFGDLLFATGRTLPAWLLAAGVSAIFIPFIIAADRTIWQSKVEPAIQGRVFSVSGMFRNASQPLGYLLAGPLADRVFGPAMQPTGVLAPYFGWLVGTGPGAGIGLMFVCTAVLGALMSASGYLFHAIRNVEEELPDYEENWVIQENAT